jgi:CxxC motif-containing protein
MEKQQATELIKVLTRIANALEKTDPIDKKKIANEQKIMDLEEKLKRLQIASLIREHNQTNQNTDFRDYPIAEK